MLNDVTGILCVPYACDLPEINERREQINSLEVVKKLDSIGMQHLPLPIIWDGVHLVDEGKFAGKTEIERRTRLAGRSRMWG